MKKLGLFKLLFISIFLFGCEVESIAQSQPELREEVYVETSIFKVWYSEVKEQPTKLIYTSTNRPKNADRGSMDFWVPKDVHTSDSKDYYRNIYDKGHLAPAATFSDSKENLKATFS